ncbi:MAG: glycosyltransferase [Ignavibacteriales bacterium]|nr:glycosyltransferase [Ignavibacteriales bacterium]
MNKTAEKYKILYFDMQIPYLLKGESKPIGGAAIEWITWLEAFNKIGTKAALLTWKDNSFKKIKHTNFEIIESFELDKGIPKIRFLTYQLPQLIKVVRRYKPDIIAQEGANRYTGIFALISKILNISFVHRIASDMDVDGRISKNMSNYYLKFYYWGIKSASHISCQNEYQYEHLRKKYSSKNISILYNPFKLEHNLNGDIKKEYIAWIGNFRFEKNLPALANIAKKLPQISFKIAGTRFHETDDDTFQGLKILESLENVEFVGHLENKTIPLFLSKSFCLLNTSRLEGFSNTFLEAWSVGVPVITTKNVNPDNLINKHNLGIVAENYDKLPDIISSLIESENYKKYYYNCFNYVKNNHDPLILAEQFLKEMNIKR